MHNRTGVKYDRSPNDFWRRIYDRLSLTDEMLFPMVTPADDEKIKAYFHCGLIAVRPQRKILRRWADDFKTLYTDSELAAMCRADVEKRIFLHQTALTGSILHTLTKDEMHQLSERYNYPVFFEKQYGGTKTFDSIERAVTVRCLVSEEKMGRDWYTRLNGAPEKIAWLRAGWLSE
jgi:hypothetical protein